MLTNLEKFQKYQLPIVGLGFLRKFAVTTDDIFYTTTNYICKLVKKAKFNFDIFFCNLVLLTSKKLNFL